MCGSISYRYAFHLRNRCLHTCVSFLEGEKGFLATLPWRHDKRLALFVYINNSN